MGTLWMWLSGNLRRSNKKDTHSLPGLPTIRPDNKITKSAGQQGDEW